MHTGEKESIENNIQNDCAFGTPIKHCQPDDCTFELCEDSLNIQKNHQLSSEVKIRSERQNKNGNFDVGMIKEHHSIVKKYIESLDIFEYKNDTTKASGQSIEFKANSTEKPVFNQIYPSGKIIN